MKANAMKRAHEIRRNAAAKFNCKVSEISMSECLKMAWTEVKNADLFGLFERAAKLCVTGKAGLQKLYKASGKNNVVDTLTFWAEKSKAKNHQELGLWLNLEINKL